MDNQEITERTVLVPLGLRGGGNMDNQEITERTVLVPLGLRGGGNGAKQNIVVQLSWCPWV